MKRHLNLIITIILTLAAGIASFTITRGSAVTGTTAPENHMSNWLELSSAQNEAIQTSEPHFQQEAAELSEAFRQERQTLARLFDDAQNGRGGRWSCKYFQVCGSRDNCARCKGYARAEKEKGE